MLFHGLLSLAVLAPGVLAATTLSGSAAASSTADGDAYASGSVTYVDYATTVSEVTSRTTAKSTAAGTMSDFSSVMAAANSSSTSSTSSATVTLLSGGGKTTANSTGMHNATGTSSSAVPTNTQPCNGYVDFCSRNFSNITYVAAHNSPFNRKGNAASNQVYDVTTQLNDGIRMLQMQAHLENGTMYLCHTSCDILNAGTLTDYLTLVRKWLAANPYEVITILIGNYDLVDPGNFTAPYTDSGLINYVYTPSKVPMAVDDWPTLAEMILSQKRVVAMIDYQANQTAIPWLLDEFGQMWESPFSPTDAAFPCTAERPPSSYSGALPRTNRMYMANHNLNVDVTIASFSLLVPAYTLLNETNASTNTTGALQRMALNCTSMWGRPPNYLLVDYYNYGNFNGSVFQVAANMNNVTYDRSSCCNTDATSAAPTLSLDSTKTLLFYTILNAIIGSILIL